MSTATYYISKTGKSGSVVLWPMSAYGEMCFSVENAEAKLAELVAASPKGSKFSLYEQHIIYQNGKVLKYDGKATLVKTVESA